MSEAKVRITKKFTLYILKSVASAAGLEIGDYVKMRVEDSKIIIERMPDPFELALKGSKFAKIKFDEFERESEEMRDEIFGRA